MVSREALLLDTSSGDQIPGRSHSGRSSALRGMHVPPRPCSSLDLFEVTPTRYAIVEFPRDLFHVIMQYIFARIDYRNSTTIVFLTKQTPTAEVYDIKEERTCTVFVKFLMSGLV